MKPFIRHSVILAGFLAASILSGCNKSGDGPTLLPPEEDVGPQASEAPSVDEALAREAGIQRLIYHVGPVDLPAGTSPSEMFEHPLTMRFQTDREMWVMGFVPRVVDVSGGELPAELLHQAIIFNMHEENPLCAGSPNPFAAATAMLTEVNLPQGYGYPILATDPIEAKVVLANPTEKSYSDVYFELTLVAKQMSDFVSIKDVQPMFLELDPCSHAPMEVEPQDFAQRSATYQIPVAASLIVAQGLLQDFGSAVQLTSGLEIMPFWRAEAVQDDEHRVRDLTSNPFEDAEGVSFKAGDQITLGVSYNNLSDEWLKGATAGAMVYLAPK